jgi:hypothetical protein
MLKLLIISPILGIISISIITKIKNLLYTNTTITTSHLTLPLKSLQSVPNTIMNTQPKELGLDVELLCEASSNS